MQLSKEKFKSDFEKKLMTLFSVDIKESSRLNQYHALASLVRDYCSENWMKTNKDYINNKEKQIYYFSMEFLIGKLLVSNLINLGIKKICIEGLKDLGLNLNDIENIEPDAGLGNGGLGRLAACFMDSMASLKIPGHGCGIRYKYGFFEQTIKDGYQVEIPDNWLKNMYIWESRRRGKAVEVRFGGNAYLSEENGHLKAVYENFESILAVPYDIPIIGYKNSTVNTLRLWSAEAIDKEFDYPSFNKGNYTKAVEYKYSVESISQVLYPDDTTEKGKLLRLKQEYFFVSAGIQSIISSFKKLKKPMSEFCKYIAIHVNDTHPSLAVAELMRILIDEESLGWDDAWNITINTIAYTNHTIMSEALEKWPITIFEKLLPRIYMIVEEINRRFCNELFNRYYGDWNKINTLSIIQDGYVRMAHLAIVGSHSVNGVAKLHTEILTHQELKDFYDLYPEKFNNKTNGITHRRWLIKCNPRLSDYISSSIGTQWIENPLQLNKLLDLNSIDSTYESIGKIKLQNKIDYSNYIKSRYNIDIDPHSIFDVQIKRLHAYKRQLLNVFHIMYLYNQIKNNPNLDIVPRTFFFGAKAAPGYKLAKEIIKLINSVAYKINRDKSINNKLKVVFIENYNVSAAERIIPAADVSEQISTASKEASGTGNMKFMMNGAITIGTLDGANIEILDAVGKENIVTFGLTSTEVIDYYKYGGYNAVYTCETNAYLKEILSQLTNGFLDVSPYEFSNIHNHLTMYNDEFFVLKDFNSYVKAHEKINSLYKNNPLWNKICLTNISKSGIFSSDNTIINYHRDIWSN